ncbi:unnamed protein product [Rotaria magnacalcarata]|uniref:VWFA domain-containing protein n=1 Tax=Rotaria magnacalcarata TaxID=392030 RepID=A0A816U5E0_9BILA|nr:unnamed protein product [Rotaria magnacalcarata]CAF3934254.1 unnamed protein product [Rotaria magnacalcarata]
MLFGTVTCFKTGTCWFGQPASLGVWESNHYLITTCALYRLAITHLQDVYDHNYLAADFQAINGSCRDVHMIITTELAKFNISSRFFRLAREEIALANIMADLIYDPASYTHFDNEEFENGSKFVMMQLRAAQSSLARREWQYARMAIGFMLHSMQDFYSHSNWIELGMREPNRDLAMGRRLGSTANKDTRTCKSCNGSDEDCIRNNLIVDQYLTTGYFSYTYPIQTPPGKCHHGYTCDFPGENSEYCEGISKDSMYSPHRHLHYTAASVAYSATTKVLNELRASTNTYTFGKFLGLTNSFSLVFVIDVSNRLQPLVGMIRTVTSQLVDSVQNISNKPSNYILSPFNGSHWGPIRVVTKINEFFDLIESLNETKLQHSSKHYYDSLNEALKACESESLVFFFTDAPSHEPCPQGLTRALARLKKTKIDVLFVNSSQSTSETISELNHFAVTTGGLFINIDITQPKINGKFIYRRLQETLGYECILFESMSNHSEGVFMIDTTATSFHINVVSSSPSIAFQLIEPMGSMLRRNPSVQSDYLQMFSIVVTAQSDVGQWKYTCSEDCVIEVNMKSEFRCRTQLYAPLSNELSEGIVVTPPLFNQSGVATMTTCDDPNQVSNNSIQLISTTGDILSEYLATNGFIQMIKIPLQSFRIGTCITRHDGTLAYRDERPLIEISRIMMIVHNQPLVAISDERLNVTYRIQNDANRSLYVQLDIDGVLKNSKWYSINSKSPRSDFIIIDTSQYPLKNETVRFIPLIFTLQAFKDNKQTASDEILFRHEQIVPFYVQDSDIHLEASTHFVNTA